MFALMIRFNRCTAIVTTTFDEKNRCWVGCIISYVDVTFGECVRSQGSRMGSAEDNVDWLLGIKK